AVTIADINAVKGEEAIKEITKEFGANRAIFVKTDVTKVDQLESAFKITLNTWKTIDVVINNAGVMNDGQWELEIAINCNAVVRGTLLALQYMGKDKGGKGGVIVNIASILGLQPLPGCPIYVGTKHFVVGFDRSLGTPYHYNRTGVKILTMCPGVTDTPLISEANKYALATLSPDIGQQLAKELGNLPAQPTENVARGMMTLITKGDNGSVWVCEGNEPIYEVNIPDRLTYRKS
ncbi:hypothetical protein ILUMI_07151, partial [Ignelater luminosus]